MRLGPHHHQQQQYHHHYPHQSKIIRSPSYYHHQERQQQAAPARVYAEEANSTAENKENEEFLEDNSETIVETARVDAEEADSTAGNKKNEEVLEDNSKTVVEGAITDKEVEEVSLRKEFKKKRSERVTSYKKVGWVGPQNHISRRNEIVTQLWGGVRKFIDVIFITC